MKNTFLFLVAFLLSFNSFSQYVVTRTDTIFGKVIYCEYDNYSKYILKIGEKDTIRKILLDSIVSITKDNSTTILNQIIEENKIRSKIITKTVGKELIKYGKLNNIASGLEVVGYVVTGVGGVTLNPPIMIGGGVVYLISWIVRTSSYKHVKEAGKISDGYYKNSMKPIQIIQ